MIFVKKSILISILCGLLLPLFALPGIQEVLPTENGQYVYYRDYTFKHEAYIGFLQYNSTTYAIKYISKEPTKGLPIVELIFTVDPDNEKIDLTGEKIVQQVTNDDTDVMNYMHDLLYELVARRKNKNDSDFSKIFSSSEEYPQFGGTVTFTFNPIIPLFNIDSITAKDGTLLLQAVIIGQISDKTEAGWDTFTGIPNNVPTNSQQLDSDMITDDDFYTLNAQWKQVMDNFFLMGNNALMFVTDVKTSERLSLLRRFSFSTIDTTIFLQNQDTKTLDNGTIILSNISKASASDVYQIDIKILSPIVANTCTITGITVYTDYYNKNKEYFNKLIEDNSQK